MVTVTVLAADCLPLVLVLVLASFVLVVSLLESLVKPLPDPAELVDGDSCSSVAQAPVARAAMPQSASAGKFRMTP